MGRPTCWIVQAAQPNKAAKYCGKTTSWHMAPDEEDGSARRVYNSFCDEHQPIVDKQNLDDIESGNIY